MSSVLIGLDVGTTAAKAVACALDGKVLGVGRAPLSWDRVDAGAEIGAPQLMEAGLAAVGQALDGTADPHVLALGVTSMGESSVLLDRSGRPVAPLIAWHDSRDRHELAELAADIGEQEFMGEVGLPFREQWSLTKHRWQTRHDPRVRAAVSRLGVAEWVVRALGGDEVCEQSLASRTGWFRLHERAWWDAAVEWSGLAPSALPDVVEAGTPVGRVTAAWAPSCLLGATLTVAGHDHQAAAVGADATEVGAVLDSCGTAEALVRTIAPGLDRDAVVTLARAGITVGWHAEPGRWCLLGGTQGGLALQRTLAVLGLTHGDISSLDASPAADVGVVVEGVDQDALVIRGIGGGASPSAVWQAALTAVTERGERVNAAMSEVTGPHSRFVVTGGWAASEALIARKQAAFGPLERVQVPEAGARGAARFAGAAAGVSDLAGAVVRPDHDHRGEDPS